MIARLGERRRIGLTLVLALIAWTALHFVVLPPGVFYAFEAAVATSSPGVVQVFYDPTGGAVWAEGNSAKLVISQANEFRQLQFSLPAPCAFPSMMNQCGARNAVAWGGLARFTLPFLRIGGVHDKQFGTAEIQNQFIAVVPGARGQRHGCMDAGHFIRDNKGEELADRIIAFIAETPLADAQP